MSLTTLYLRLRYRRHRFGPGFEGPWRLRIRGPGRVSFGRDVRVRNASGRTALLTFGPDARIATISRAREATYAAGGRADLRGWVLGLAFIAFDCTILYASCRFIPFSMSARSEVWSATVCDTYCGFENGETAISRSAPASARSRARELGVVRVGVVCVPKMGERFSADRDAVSKIRCVIMPQAKSLNCCASCANLRWRSWFRPQRPHSFPETVGQHRGGFRRGRKHCQGIVIQET